MKASALYIETTINTPLDVLWEHTQNPTLHEQWDLRFSSITYLPKASNNEPQRFEYAARLGFGIRVAGVGESVGTKTLAGGESTSVLKFSSDSPISIIETGSGYWKYVPKSTGIRFFTGYDYATRWGLLGRLIDAIVFRPMIRWATALSFDALKLWLERGIHPSQSLRARWNIMIASLSTGFVWLYLGLVPKILFPESGEQALLDSTHLFGEHARAAIACIGVFEIAFGLLMILGQRRYTHILSILALLGLCVGAGISTPAVLTWPFNPLVINMPMIGLSLIALINYKNAPSAQNCIIRQPK